MMTMQFDRAWSWMDPDFTYNVTDLVTNRRIGAVGRLRGQARWHASNITWTGGGELGRTFPTRWEAAVALRFIADGEDPEMFGGYVREMTDAGRAP